MTVKVITVGEKVLVANEVKAKENKARLDNNQHILTINIMSSPGAGKTSLILSTIKHFKNKIPDGRHRRRRGLQRRRR